MKGELKVINYIVLYNGILVIRFFVFDVLYWGNVIFVVFMKYGIIFWVLFYSNMFYSVIVEVVSVV